MKRFKITLDRKGCLGEVSFYYDAETVRQAHAKALRELKTFNDKENIKGAFWVIEYIREEDAKKEKTSIWKWLLRRQKAK